MGLIALEGMHFHANHGFYPEEEIIGNEFIVDVYIETDFGKASKEDDLFKTINYETVFLICQSEMKYPSKLLENVVSRIIKALKHQFSNMKSVNVRLTKLNPPLLGKVDKAIVEDGQEFSKKCGRCGKGLSCYSDDSCWCNAMSIPKGKLDSINAQFKGCLCPKCLAEFV